ncbi:PDZ domain-containing protein [Streptomyces tsukubensis]|uniref:PDZ domain-containing protein n=1 Tax=Streptomyces tsukubensis TaxID=83656 RepID=UPI00098FA742|nr:PDZ domain-containing protein [Streptomyces tsukubensis]
MHRSRSPWALTGPAATLTAVLVAVALPPAHAVTAAPAHTPAAVSHAPRAVMIPPQQDVPELNAPGDPVDVVFPPDNRTRPGTGRFTVTAPPHTRITALGMRCLTNSSCSAAIAGDGSTATVTLRRGRWTFSSPVTVTLQASPSAPLPGGRYAGVFTAGNESQPLTVEITEGNQGTLGISHKDAPDRGGAQVVFVGRGGAADTAGIREGDIITSINNTPVTTSNELRNARLGKLRQGATIPVTYRQPNGTTRTTQVTLT